MNTFPICHFGSSEPPSQDNSLWDGLIGLWEMDDPSGTTIVDVSGNSYDLEAKNGALVNQTGVIDKCVVLDGTNDRLDYNTVANDLNPEGAMTLSVWFRKDDDNQSAGNQGYIVSKFRSSPVSNRCYALGILNSTGWGGSNNRILFASYDSNNVSRNLIHVPASDIWLNNWVHCVCTRDGANQEMWLDGISITTQTNGTGLQNQNSSIPWHIGARSESTPDYEWPGAIDQTGLWDRALTDTEVGNLYNSGSGFSSNAWG